MENYYKKIKLSDPESNSSNQESNSINSTQEMKWKTTNQPNIFKGKFQQTEADLIMNALKHEIAALNISKEEFLK